MPPVADDGDAAPTGYIPMGRHTGRTVAANGASYWADGAGYGPSPEEPAVHDVRLNRADDHLPQADGRYANGTHVNGGYVNGTYADKSAYDDGAYDDGAYDDSGAIADECLAPRLAQPRRLRVRAVGQRLVGLRAVHRRGGDRGRTVWREYASPGPETSWYQPQHRPFGPDREPGAGREFGAGRDHGPVPEATPISGSRPPSGRPSSAPGRPRASRPPMPGRTSGPCRCPSSGRRRNRNRNRSVRVGRRSDSRRHDPGAAGSRSRRAGGAAEERAAGSPGRTPQPGTPERWRPERRPDEQPR